MKIIEKNKYGSLEEGFRASKTTEMIEKLMNVIGRRINLTDINISSVPDYYANQIGSFIGYFVKYNNNKILRFNFEPKGSSNKFYSIDLYDIAKMQPNKTIDLLGYNVVEVVDFISEVLSGKSDLFLENNRISKGKLSETSKYEDRVRAWINEDDERISQLRSIISNSNRQQVKDRLEELRPQFVQYLMDNRQRDSANSQTAFIYWVKRILREQGENTENIASIEVRRGTPENVRVPSESQQQAYNDLMDNSHIFKFKALRRFCNEIKNGNDKFKSLYIYGDGGIGKSYWVKKILAGLPNATMITGKISGYTGFVKVLYENREGKILILDDTVSDKDMKSPTIAGILKVALDPDPPREIQVIKSRHRESSYEKGKFYLNEQDFKEFRKYKSTIKPLNEEDDDDLSDENEVDFVDMTSTLESPDRFNFDSTTIFITNYKEVPQPVQDRCWILQMEFNNKQILDIIEDALKKSIPQADPDVLEEAYEEVELEPNQQETINILRGMEANKQIPRKLSFRVFNRLVALKQLGISKEETDMLMKIELGN